MDPDFWVTRWKEGRIAFHEGRPNASLQSHIDVLGEHRRVLVPLCGKSEDLAYLASRGHEVTGIELVEDALQAFFAEHSLQPTRAVRGSFVALSAGTLTLLAGDFFEASKQDLGAVNALYDRAAMIALPKDLRARYVQHLRALLPSGTPGLLITVEYGEEELSAPPFSVPEAEVRQLYAGAQVELIEDAVAQGGRFSQEGVSARQKTYLLKL